MNHIIHGFLIDYKLALRTKLILRSIIIDYAGISIVYSAPRNTQNKCALEFIPCCMHVC
jgi:hypothetical protein